MKNFCLQYIKYLLFILPVIFLASCSATKYVPEEEYLLNRVRIESDTKRVPKTEISAFVRQTPNSRMLSLWRTQLGLYNLSGPDTSKWINRFWRRIGEEPVILNPQLTTVSEREIQKHFKNKGFMNAEVTSTVTYPGPKKADVTYIIKSNRPYYLKNYNVNIFQNELYKIATDTAESLIKTNKLFDSYTLDKERARITAKFRELGYYNFQKSHLHFYADSALNTHSVDLVLELNNNLIKDTLDPVFTKFHINKVNFYSEADKNFENPDFRITLDTVVKDKYVFVYENVRNIRPNVFIETTHIIPGKTYSDLAVERTYSSINSLSAVKYMTVSFEKTDSNYLDAFIKVSPNKLQSVSADVEGTYSSGYWGAGTNINYSHRNAFKGSESINLKGRFAYEYQGSGQNAIELGGDAGVRFPTFLFPFASTDLKRQIRANTTFTGTYSYRLRPSEYTGIIFGGGIKYNWSEKFNHKHSLDLIDISYVRYPWISQAYQDNFLVKNPNFWYNFKDHFIIRTAYSGSVSTFNPTQPFKNYSAMTYGVELAGNMLYAANKLFNAKKVTDGDFSYYTLFNIRFAQYVKTDYNISHHQIFDENNRIVYHAGLGVAVPYGNAYQIPLEKRYFSGGANSVRGWTPYQLGPGTFAYPRKNYVNYNTQMGDIKIDLNMEYRAKLFWKMDLGIFLDAGNVWTIRDYKEQPGGVFKFDTFLNQLAIAYGAGLRLDFSFFVIRLDGGLKLYNPALTRTERWRTNPGKDDFALNLAIGYPF